MMHHRNAIAGFVLFLATIVLTEIVFVRVMPMSFWVDYVSIEPVACDIDCGDTIRFISKRHVARPVFATWSDVVWCFDANGKKVYTQDFESSGELTPGGKEEAVWIYDEPLPCARTCYLESTTTLHLPYNITRTRTLTSKQFTSMTDVPTEHAEAVAFAAYLRGIGLLSHHIANENQNSAGANGKKKWGSIARRKAEGVSKGISDYLIRVPADRSISGKNALVWVELKRSHPVSDKTGKQLASPSTTSAEQKQFIEFVNGVPGSQGSICYGADEAVAFVKKFLRW